MDSRRAHVGTRILGLTGPIGCGKTTVGDLLIEFGATERIDADHVVHGLMAPGGVVVAPISQAFGADVQAADGSIDRKRLADIVFGDPEALRCLEAIVHPAVRAVIRDRIAGCGKDHGTIVVDAVRLLQSDLLPLVEAVWVVRCAPDEQLDRLTTQRGMSVADAQNRIAAQPSFEHERVSTIIENSESLGSLRTRVQKAWNEWLRSPAHASSEGN